MKNILLMSGGNDSMYIYHKFEDKNFDCVYIDYGQEYVSDELDKIPDGKSLLILDIPPLKIEKNGYVGGRNLMFLATIAKHYRRGTIWMGSNADDIFPDNNSEFLKKAIEVINISFDTHFKLRLPLKNITKKEIMKYIRENNISTYSCYKGGTPCGICKACRSVKNAT